MAGEPNSVQCTKLTIFLAITTVVFLIISVVSLTLLAVEINKANVSECPAGENGREDPPQVNHNAYTYILCIIIIMVYIYVRPYVYMAFMYDGCRVV